MAETSVSYVAIDGDGRRVRGRLAAHDEASAFEALRRQGYSPVSLRLRAKTAPRTRPSLLRAREAADVLSSLAELLRAGADIRMALGLLSERFEREEVRRICRNLANDIADGQALERAFARAFERQPFAAPMVAAGETSGDLPGSLQRAADAMSARIKLTDQLVSVFAYPAFVAVSAVLALIVILFFIVPSIAPLAEDAGATPPLMLRLLISASDGLRSHLAIISGLAVVSLLALAFAIRVGLFTEAFERALIDGPARKTFGGLTFGSFAISLGNMLAGGAAMNEALRLAVRTVRSSAARRRLETVLPAVREGRSLSDALSGVRGFPNSLVRLAAIGEASNAMGELLERGGRMEEQAAMRNIEQFGRIAGPALIIILGMLLGSLMGGLLSGINNIGGAALG